MRGLCGAGNLACSRLSGGSFVGCASPGRRLKAGCSQDWLPHNLLSLTVLLLLLALPALAQEFEDLKFEHLALGYRFTEGPAWSKEGGYLVFSDTPSDRLLKWVPGTEITVYRTDAHGPAGKDRKSTRLNSSH